MEPAHIAITRNGELRPLGVGGQLVTQVWQQLSAHLESRFGPAHAALLAEPQADADRGETNWYAQGLAAVAFSATDPATQETTRATLARIISDIEAEVARLEASRADGDRLLAQMLRLALIIPDPAFLWVVDSAPVIIAWGHRRGEERAGPEVLLGLAAPAAARTRARPVVAPMEIIAPPPPPPQPWAPLAVLAALVALLLVLTLLLWRDPFGWFAGARVCVIAPNDLTARAALMAERDREGQLRAQIAAEVERLARARAQCAGPAPVPAPVPVPRPATPPVPNPDADRAREQGARTGRIQVILAWDNTNDLDLAVVCPDGVTRIFFGNLQACGGMLDVDRNAGAGSALARPVENIVFERNPPAGTYRILVHHYATRPGQSASTPFRVTIRRAGQPDQVIPGTIATGQVAAVANFQIQ